VRIGCVTTIVDDYREALGLGFMLAVFVPSPELFSYVLNVIGRIETSVSLSDTFRLFVFVDFPRDVVPTSELAKFCDVVDMEAHLNVKTLMRRTISWLPVTIFDTQLPGQTNLWRRIVLLLAFFDSVANLLRRVVFNDQCFAGENFELMLRSVKQLSPIRKVEKFGEFFVNNFYSVETPDLAKFLLERWRQIFTGDNFDREVAIFFEKYRFPLIFPPSRIPGMLAEFPLLDNANLMCLGDLADFPSQILMCRFWKNCVDTTISGDADPDGLNGL
jgi:hypothetical protein